MSNYLLPSITAYFEEICSLTGKLNLVAGFLEEKSKELIKQNLIAGDIVGSITMYRDLSKDYGTHNLLTPNFNYGISLKTLNNETENLVSRESCYTVAQAYEVFESYFLQILTEYIKHRTDKLAELNLLKSNFLSDQDIRALIRNASGTNNKGLIKLTKKISEYFKSYESNNYFNVNIFQWFDLISMVRHTLVHNRQKISKKLTDYLEEHKGKEAINLFHTQLGRKNIDGKDYIFLTPNQAIDIITWLNSFAHLIFKSISVDSDLPVDIPRYVPPAIQIFYH